MNWHQPVPAGEKVEEGGADEAGGGGGEDAGDGDEVFVAGDIAIKRLKGGRSSSCTSNFEPGNRGEVFNAAVALLLRVHGYIQFSLLCETDLPTEANIVLLVVLVI